MLKVTNPVDRWGLSESEAFEVRSEAVGQSFAIGVARPMAHAAPGPDETTDAGPPRLVYVLDGSPLLGMTATIARAAQFDMFRPGFPPLQLVGIDYPWGSTNCRSRDYTMNDSVRPDMVTMLSGSSQTAPGGADNFLAFLEDELDPLIRSRYDVSDAPAGIVGDSFGGTFTFHAFLRQSRLFDRYWLGSPGIFTTGTDYVAAFAEVLQKPLVHDTRMYLSLGELEASGPIDFYADMGANYQRTVEALAAHPNPRLAYRSHVYPGHTHTSVVAPALNDAILYLYGEPV